MKTAAVGGNPTLRTASSELKPGGGSRKGETVLAKPAGGENKEAKGQRGWKTGQRKHWTET